MKNKLFILYLLFSVGCKHQKEITKYRPGCYTTDSVIIYGSPIEPGDMPHLGYSWESDYKIDTNSPKTLVEDAYIIKPPRDQKRNTSKFIEAREIDWGVDFSKSSIETYYVMYINEDGIIHELWKMFRKGNTLHIDSIVAKEMFIKSDTIKVAGKVFVAQTN